MKKALQLVPFAVLTLIIVISSFYLISETEPPFSFASANIIKCPVVIIDPGHGGEDGGAVSPSGVKESGINLDISVKARDIFLLFGISPVMTRDSEAIDYPPDAVSISEKKTADQKNRASLINSYADAVLISIHQNKFQSEGPRGAQVLYAKTEGSREFAMHLQSLIVDKLDSSNRRAAVQIPDEIYLMRKISCPAILVECGFLSNLDEERLLKTDTYRIKTAMTIVGAFFTSDLRGAGEESA